MYAIPDEVWLHTFVHSEATDLGRIACTNKLLNRLSQDNRVWRAKVEQTSFSAKRMDPQSRFFWRPCQSAAPLINKKYIQSTYQRQWCHEYRWKLGPLSWTFAENIESEPVWDIRYCPSYQLLVSLTENILYYHQVKEGEMPLLKKITCGKSKPIVYPTNDPPDTMDGALVIQQSTLYCSSRNILQQRELETSVCLASVPAHQKGITTMVTIDSAQLLTASSDKTIKLWDFRIASNEKSCVRCWDTQETVLSLLMKGNQVLGSGRFFHLKSIDLRFNEMDSIYTGRLIFIHGLGINGHSLCESGIDNQIIVAGGNNSSGYLSLVDLNSGSAARLIRFQGHHLTSVYRNDSGQIFGATWGGVVFLLSPCLQHISRVLMADSTSPVTCLESVGSQMFTGLLHGVGRLKARLASPSHDIIRSVNAHRALNSHEEDSETNELSAGLYNMQIHGIW